MNTLEKIAILFGGVCGLIVAVLVTIRDPVLYNESSTVSVIGNNNVAVVGDNANVTVNYNTTVMSAPTGFTLPPFQPVGFVTGLFIGHFILRALVRVSDWLKDVL